VLAEVLKVSREWCSSLREEGGNARASSANEPAPGHRETAASDKALCGAFLAQDLSGLDFSKFKPAKFEFEKKDEQINMRISKPLLAALKARAQARGIPYTRFIRETLERAIAPK
jgi:predicted DNA binding CopG/RHH family protein